MGRECPIEKAAQAGNPIRGGEVPRQGGERGQEDVKKPAQGGLLECTGVRSDGLIALHYPDCFGFVNTHKRES